MANSVSMKANNSDEVDAASRYTMTATAYDNCTVDFELTSRRPEGYSPSFQADYSVGDEPAVMRGNSRGEATYRPVLGSHQGIEDDIKDAVKGRDNPYDFDTNQVTVDLTEPRTVPQYDDPSLVTVLPGIEPNEDGTHEITFGAYQGPNSAPHNEYSFDTGVTVEGCPTAGSGPIGSLVDTVDVLGSLGAVTGSLEDIS